MTTLEKFHQLGMWANPNQGYMGMLVADMTKEELLIVVSDLCESLQREKEVYRELERKLLGL